MQMQQQAGDEKTKKKKHFVDWLQCCRKTEEESTHRTKFVCYPLHATLRSRETSGLISPLIGAFQTKLFADMEWLKEEIE